MRRDLLKRLETLEAADAQLAVVWIGAPEAGIEGWEILPGDGALHVWRRPGETDEDLQTRAAAEANRHRGMVVCFAMDARGGTR